MPALPPQILELAESLNARLPVSRGEERIERPGWVLWLGDGTHPALNVAPWFRLRGDEVEAAVAEIRATFAERGRPCSTWEIGPSTTRSAPPRS